MPLKKELTSFDLTAIVVGSIVGADIYIASALTAGLLGPAAILVWVAAGLCATVIALVFAYCSYYVPRVGGPFAYVSEAFDDFYGFLTGWSIWIAEILSLPVFAIAFVQYLQYFVQFYFHITLNDPLQILIKGLFLFTLTYINIRGVKAAGRVNDVLTVVKLAPLLLLIIFGFGFFILNPQTLSLNYLPFAPYGFGNFGAALILIFWAYVGFEMGTLPASEVKDPQKTIPKAIITGMIIVTIFYLLTNFVVYGLIDPTQLATSKVPLVLAGTVVLGVTVGVALMAIGALVSVSGSDESGILGTARLSYAMSIDGLFPKLFSKEHPKYRTPYMALLIQGIIAFALCIFSGLSDLISFSVFNLAFAFLLTCLALLVLRKRKQTKKLHGQRILPVAGILICLYLITMYLLGSVPLPIKIIGIIVIALGIPLYVFFSPKTDIHHLKELFLSEEAVFLRQFQRTDRFLAHFIKHIHRWFQKMKSKKEEQ
ncbi:MAG: amino acid permease [Euryarchaeota archaeon]|nr:amino acid permease [Euryarchaeota archaeon]